MQASQLLLNALVDFHKCEYSEYITVDLVLTAVKFAVN